MLKVRKMAYKTEKVMHISDKKQEGFLPPSLVIHS